jgi:hypothetical protein
VYFASIPGKAFTGFLMEIIGRRWTIAYALAGSLPGHHDGNVAVPSDGAGERTGLRRRWHEIHPPRIARILLIQAEPNYLSTAR